MFYKIGFIGTGNMGSAIAKSIKNPDVEFYLSNKTVSKAEDLAKQLNNAKVVSNIDVARECDIIFLAVKPYYMEDVLKEISDTLNRRRDIFVLCSMAAALTAATIKKMSKCNCPVIRMMPNTPCAIGCGVTTYCGLDTTEGMLTAFEDLLKDSGLVQQIEEDKIDAASSVAGCGPAFTYMFIEALSDAGVKCGLSRKQAIDFAAKMVEGSARMVLETGKHPGALKDEVTSPKGTTIEGVQQLEEHGFRAAAMSAVVAAYEKTIKLK